MVVEAKRDGSIRVDVFSKKTKNIAIIDVPHLIKIKILVRIAKVGLGTGS